MSTQMVDIIDLPVAVLHLSSIDNNPVMNTQHSIMSHPPRFLVPPPPFPVNIAPPHLYTAPPPNTFPVKNPNIVTTAPPSMILSQMQINPITSNSNFYPQRISFGQNFTNTGGRIVITKNTPSFTNQTNHVGAPAFQFVPVSTTSGQVSKQTISPPTFTPTLKKKTQKMKSDK